MKAISLFDYTGKMVLPWAEAGYDCLIVDAQHPEGFSKSPLHDRITCMQGDMLEWIPPREWVDDVVAVFAFPPCDHMAVSGARWFQGKGLGKLAHSIELFHKAAQWCEWLGGKYLIENPVSTISSYWRKPDYTFHPYQYAGFEPSDNYTKKTCLWTGGGFVMPKPMHPDDIEPDNRIHMCPPGPERANIRSATPLGFARAVFEASA